MALFCLPGWGGRKPSGRINMTQLETALKGCLSEEMELCARQEGVSPEFIRKGVSEGNIVVIRNNKIS